MGMPTYKSSQQAPVMLIRCYSLFDSITLLCPIAPLETLRLYSRSKPQAEKLVKKGVNEPKAPLLRSVLLP